jgi:hypothetical protein
MMNLAPALMMLSAQLLIPVSDQVPRLNVSPSCRAAASVAIADSQSFDGCMKDEDSARQELVKVWQTYPVADRGRCSSEASLGGVDSYVDLLVCLQMTRDAEAMHKNQLKGAKRK